MEYIRDIKNYKPKGHYSTALIHDGLIFISGQLPINLETGDKVFGTISEEISLVLKNIDIILNEAGSSKDKVLKTTVYVTELSKWEEVNTIYSQFFGDHFPARSVVSVAELHFGVKVEMEVIAAI